MLSITRATRRDWQRFSHLHYRGNGLGPSCAVWLARVDGAEAGMAVLCYAGLAAMGRRGRLPEELVTGHNAVRGCHINQRLRVLERLVVKPSFRGKGVGHALIAHTLKHAPTEFVEVFAMNPRLLASAGFTDFGPNPLEKNRQQLLEFCEGLGLAPELLQRPASREVLLRAIDDEARSTFLRLEEAAFRYWLRCHGGVCRRWEAQAAGISQVPARYLARFWARIDERVHYLLWRKPDASR